MPDYPPGTPCWIELASPDPDVSLAFYKQLFGWDAEMRGDPEQTGGYRTLTLNGKSVGGLSPLMNEQQPPVWTTYVCTADADETIGKVKGAGGQVLAEPMDVMDLGRFAFFMDPTGAALGIWQPDLHTGAEYVNRTGTWGWNELQTRDSAKAIEFYSAVFGWDAEESQVSETYKIWKNGDRVIGGVIQMDENFPPDIPSNWLIYFAVEDTDATVTTAQSAGGNPVVPPTDIPELGRFAVIQDPNGSVFAVIALVPEAIESSEKMAAEIGA